MMKSLLLGLYAIMVSSALSAADKPNIIFILADDLGYGELGCYGQKVVQTPYLDNMAKEGLRFTQFYSGATVCAPSRSVLMTGLHHGHTRVRGNAGKQNPMAQALHAEDVTVAKVLRDAGYETSLIGKWGLGDIHGAESGLPRKHGFNRFFGYLNQSHAHNHFPNFLWRNEAKETLPNQIIPVGTNGAGYAIKRGKYVGDLFTEETLKFLETLRSQPFFLYLSLVTPHANNEKAAALKDGTDVPDYGIYADKDWPNPDKGHAAMITHMDRQVGLILKELQERKLAENTLVIFTSDNGPHNESRHDLGRFHPSGSFSGIKRALTDGGIRVPCLAWWPGKIKAGTVSDHVAYFGDWMATASELGGATLPAGLDSISFVPTLLDHVEKQKSHEFLYWEFHENGFKQAALYQGRWKGIRQGAADAPIRLYDLKQDPAEQTDVSSLQQDIAQKLSAYLSTARTPSADWEPRWETFKKRR